MFTLTGTQSREYKTMYTCTLCTYVYENLYECKYFSETYKDLTDTYMDVCTGIVC